MAFSNEENYKRIFPTSSMQRPHVETNYNDDALGKSAGDSPKHIAIIGSATDGEPNKVYELDSLLEARAVFGSGDIVNAAEVIWGPNKKYLDGGGKIYAMRVETATQAILNAPALRFQSKVWGEQANKTQIALEQSPITDSYRVTVDYSPDNYHAVYDNLGQVFKLQYVGNSPKATATYSVTKDKSGHANKFILDIQDTDEIVNQGTGVLKPTTTTSTMKLNSTTTTTTLKPTTTTTTTTVVPITNFVFDTNSASVKTGDEVQLSYKITPVNTSIADSDFTSSDKSVATVDEFGHVVTLKDGKVTITGTIIDLKGNTKSDTIELNISKDVKTDSSLLQTGTEQASVLEDVTLDMPTPSNVQANVTDGGVVLGADESGIVDDTTTTTTTTVKEPELHTIHQEFDLTLAETKRLYDLMHKLSLIPNLRVQMLAEGDNTRMFSNDLDEASNVDITGDINDIDKAGFVWALRADIVDKLQFDSYVNVEAVYDEDMSLPFGLSNMVNGTTGNVPLSWDKQIKVLAQTDSYYIVPLTSSAAVHQEVKEFVIEQSAAGHPMKAFVGAGLNEGVGQLISRQLDLKSERVSLFGTSGYFETYDETTLHLAGYMVAALAAGVASGLQIGGDITNKYVNMLSVDQTFTSQQIDQLYQNGVITIEPINNRGTESGFRFVAGITTYNSTNEPVKSKIGLGEITDFLFGDLRVALEKDFIGANVKVGSADVIKNYVASFLLKESMSENGLIVDFDENDIEVQVDGDTVYLRFTVKPSQTLDYIYVYGAYENYAESAGSSNGSLSTGTSSYNTLYGDTSDIPTTNAGNRDITKSQNPDINAGYDFN